MSDLKDVKSNSMYETEDYYFFKWELILIDDNERHKVAGGRAADFLIAG